MTGVRRRSDSVNQITPTGIDGKRARAIVAAFHGIVEVIRETIAVVPISDGVVINARHAIIVAIHECKDQREKIEIQGNWWTTKSHKYLMSLRWTIYDETNGVGLELH